MLYFLSSKFSNKFDSITLTHSITPLFLAFFCTISKAFLLISTASIILSFTYLAIDIAIEPLPVHISNTFNSLVSFLSPNICVLLFSLSISDLKYFLSNIFKILITSSTKISVSCLGIKTFSST